MFRIKAKAMNGSDINDMIDWCCENCPNTFTIEIKGSDNYFCFISEDDAMMFKLTWG